MIIRPASDPGEAQGMGREEGEALHAFLPRPYSASALLEVVARVPEAPEG